MDDALVRIVEVGILGPVVTALGYFTWRLQQQLSQAQRERVEDAQRAVEQVCELKGSVDHLTEAVKDLTRRGRG
ncbi:MAG: hypothetical protein GY772_29430 [bacterium]|nr:hypothetical protein [bacterium]